MPPIFADDVYQYCTGKLGIGTGGVTLDGAYMLDRYDLTQGYVSAINNLLLSEGYVRLHERPAALLLSSLKTRPLATQISALTTLLILLA